MDPLKTFEAQGHALFAADRMEPLDELRTKIFDKAKTLVPHKGEDAEDFFNRFHEYGLTGGALNKFRMDLMSHCNRELKVSRLLYDAFKTSLSALIGPDVVAQKGTNLVVHPPGDREQTPTHRDAPISSHFEVIVWVPLVDVFGTKSMFLSDRAHSFKALEMMQAGRTYKEFCDYIEAHSKNLDVPYGQACFFAGGIGHGCPVNVEKETRWSLNMRFKNVFSPYGLKGVNDYFELLTLSPLARVGFDFEKQEYGGK